MFQANNLQPSSFEYDFKQQRLIRLNQLKNSDIYPALRKILGPKAIFQFNQREIISEILNRTSFILAIAPTGSGKSLHYQIPSLIDPLGVTIVILPLLSLIFDQYQRAKKHGISTTIFDPRNPPDSIRLVFTTPETSLSTEFQGFLSRLRAFHQLDRIVIDECHVILTMNQLFRKRLRQLGDLVAHKTPIVLQTATLPPQYQSELLRTFNINESDIRIYRSPTNRTNIQYSVHLNQSQGQILDHIRRKSNEYLNDRLIVYARTRFQVEELKKSLKWPIYYSNSTGKEQVLRDFLDPIKKSGRIIATSSLGLGLDIPNARAIIHVDLPYALFEYAQESGRAGRDRIRSEAILLQPEKPIQFGRQLSKNEKIEQAKMSGYIHSQCRRFFLSEYLDGSGKECDNLDEKCDLCRSRSPLQPSKSIFLFNIFYLTFINLE